MLVQYLSDLHLELLTANNANKLIQRIQPNAEILVLAGDVGNPFSSEYFDLLQHCNKLFEKTLVILGNHEFYKHTIQETKDQVFEVCSNFENVVFLDNSYYDYKDFRFVGTTLWSEIADTTSKQINDTTQIKDFSIEIYNKLYEECAEFLAETLLNSEDKQVIVITHHLPSLKLIDEKYKGEYDQWFASDLDFLISNPVKAWIYGHTHTSSEKIINDVKVVCNPIGYCGENKIVSYHKCVEV